MWYLKIKMYNVYNSTEKSKIPSLQEFTYSIINEKRY